MSIRWWLALAFAAIAALTAALVAGFYARRADDSFRQRARELAAGNTVAAADSLLKAIRAGDARRALPGIAARWNLTLYVFDVKRQLIASEPKTLPRIDSVPSGEVAVSSALARRRFVASIDDGKRFVVGLPLYTGTMAVLVTIAARPDLQAELGIVRNGILRATIFAVLIGAAVGLLIALMIWFRLRRIAATAAEIDAGNFEARLDPWFRDEVGELAATVDRMRERLRASFASLEEERNRLEHLLEQLQQGVVAVDPDLRVQFANRVAAGMLRSSLGDGERLPEPWPGFSLRRLASGLFDPEAAIVNGRVSSGERTHAIVGIPPGSSSSRAVLVFSDISEPERRERAEREFVANAAHELRTPLTALAGAVEALEAGAKDDPEDRDRFLALIARQVGRLSRLGRALLVLARAQTRQEALRLEPVELRPLLDDVAAGVNPREGVALEVACPRGLTALAQRDLVEQALANLGGNAAKHTASGRIAFSARAVGARSVVIEVADTGSGIPLEEQERIFDRFYSSDRGDRAGFGLGLAIVRESVRALDGQIEIDSRPGSGTTVRITLAAAEASAA